MSDPNRINQTSSNQGTSNQMVNQNQNQNYSGNNLQHQQHVYNQSTQQPYFYPNQTQTYPANQQAGYVNPSVYQHQHQNYNYTGHQVAAQPGQDGYFYDRNAAPYASGFTGTSTEYPMNTEYRTGSDYSSTTQGNFATQSYNAEYSTNAVSTGADYVANQTTEYDSKSSYTHSTPNTLMSNSGSMSGVVSGPVDGDSSHDHHRLSFIEANPAKYTSFLDNSRVLASHGTMAHFGFFERPGLNPHAVFFPSIMTTLDVGSSLKEAIFATVESQATRENRYNMDEQVPGRGLGNMSVQILLNRTESVAPIPTFNVPNQLSSSDSVLAKAITTAMNKSAVECPEVSNQIVRQAALAYITDIIEDAMVIAKRRADVGKYFAASNDGLAQINSPATEVTEISKLEFKRNQTLRESKQQEMKALQSKTERLEATLTKLNLSLLEKSQENSLNQATSDEAKLSAFLGAVPPLGSEHTSHGTSELRDKDIIAATSSIAVSLGSISNSTRNQLLNSSDHHTSRPTVSINGITKEGYRKYIPKMTTKPLSSLTGADLEALLQRSSTTKRLGTGSAFSLGNDLNGGIKRTILHNDVLHAIKQQKMVSSGHRRPGRL